MAFKHGISATLGLGATALAGFLSSANMDLSRELAEIKTLGATSVQRVAGLENCVFTSDGDYDADTDLAIYTALASTTHAAVTFSPDAGTTTYSLNAWITAYTIKAASGAATTFTLNLSSDGTISRG